MATISSKATSALLPATRQGNLRPTAVPRLNKYPAQISSAGRRQRDVCVGALSLDWSSVETWIGVGGAFAGLGLGVGIPAFYMSLESKDEQRLEELRQLNRKTFEETGEYLTEEEINSFRLPRWTDRRQFEDDD